MALNIKNAEVERLASEVSALTGETKTEAIRKALEERKTRLEVSGSRRDSEHYHALLQTQIWDQIPPEFLGKGLAKLDHDEILGFGELGF